MIYLSETFRAFVRWFVIREYDIINFVKWKFAFRNYMNGRACFTFANLRPYVNCRIFH